MAIRNNTVSGELHVFIIVYINNTDFAVFFLSNSLWQSFKIEVGSHSRQKSVAIRNVIIYKAATQKIVSLELMRVICI